MNSALYLAKTIAPHWRRGTTVPIVMTSDYQCPSNYVVRDIQRRGSPAVRGKRQGERGELRDSSEGSPTLHFPPIEEDTTAGSCHQKAASFSALHRNVQEEAKRTFHQWGGFLRSRIIPASAASGGRSEGNDPQVPPLPTPSPLAHAPPSPYHPPHPPVRLEYDP